MSEHQNIACDELRLLIERVEKLEEEERGLKEDKRDVYAEAKSRGYDVKAMREIIRLRRMDRQAREEAEAILDTYKAAVGLN
ncbi:MAG: hypothetical protein A4S12_06920 [Proteobacteria bacterium SG_bin5]|nr:DUF2312 domain-containing protein [Sphingomonas sp.]OQW42065.1 MAG: hypothetical protein A4S12_06920 [Proteobacteria bacterium SG_bin5]